jgi:hypothetical protein
MQENNQNQFRFIIAAVLSLAVLLGWSYFYAPTKPGANSNTAANTNTAEQPVAQPTACAPGNARPDVIDGSSNP